MRKNKGEKLIYEVMVLTEKYNIVKEWFSSYYLHFSLFVWLRLTERRHAIDSYF